MNDTQVRTIELYSSEDLFLSSYNVETVDDINKVLLDIAKIAMPDDVIKFK